jgi:hypothetical protein
MADRIHSRGNGAARLTWQVMAWRTEGHHLHGRVASQDAGGDRADRRLACSVAFLRRAVGRARVEGLDPQAIERALWDDRSLVKTWAMRGTLHLLPAAELTLWQASFNTDPRYLKPFWLRNFGVTSQELVRLVAGIAEAADGRILPAKNWPPRFRGLPVPLN